MWPRRIPRAPRSSRGRAGTCPRAPLPGARPRVPDEANRCARACRTSAGARPAGPDRPPRPREAVGVHADVLDPEFRQARRDRPGIVGLGAVDDDVPPGDDALLVEDPADLGLIDAGEPGARERDGTREVAATGFAVEAPAVVAGQWTSIDHGQLRIAEAITELGGEIVGVVLAISWRMVICACPSIGRGVVADKQENPCRAGVRWVSGVRVTRIARLDTPPALLGTGGTQTAALGDRVTVHRLRSVPSAPSPDKPRSRRMAAAALSG